MQKISIIAAVDESFGLGKDNNLLCHLPADLAHFKRATLGNTIIMGRKTFVSIGKVLPGRQNIVLTHSNSIASAPYTQANSIEEALNRAEHSQIFFIGGAEIYKQVIGLADEILLTHIHHNFTADVFFPSLDSNYWQCTQSEFKAVDATNKFSMTFCCYQKIK